MVLVRVDDPEAGKIWLVSRGTLAGIPHLYARLEERKTNGNQSNPACPTQRTCRPGDVVYAMVLLAYLHPGLVVAGMVVDFSAERPPASLVQAAQTFLPHSLGYPARHADQVYDRDPAARPFRVLAGAAASLSPLLCSFVSSHVGSVFRLASKQALRPGLRPRITPDASTQQGRRVHPDPDAETEPRRDT